MSIETGFKMAALVLAGLALWGMQPAQSCECPVKKEIPLFTDEDVTAGDPDIERGE